MRTRDANYYDLLGLGLGDKPYQVFVDEVLSDLQSGRKTDGFDWSANIQMGFTYEQIEAELGLASIPTFVDINSPGAYKAREGFTLGMGSIPRGKHGFAINENILRDEMIIAQKTDRYSKGLSSKMLDLLFDSTKDLIEGNYNGLTYQRDQMISKGKFMLTVENNPDGLAGIEFKANIPDTNITTLTGSKKWFTASGEGADSDPVKDLIEQVRVLKRKGVSKMHFEVDELTYDKTIAHSKVLAKVALSLFPTTQSANLADLASVLDRNTIKSKLEALVGAPIKVVDNIVKVEGKGEVRTFEENVWVLVPDGMLGDIKAVQPIYVADPAARIATYDGGRTVLKQWFDTKTNSQYIESELTALVVPSRAMHIFHLIVG